MSDQSGGPGWWQASDGKWYAPEAQPGYLPPPPVTAFSPPPAGYSPAGYAPPRPAGTNGMAIASLVLSLVWMCGVGSLLAIIFGRKAKAEIAKTGEQGEGLATAGLVIGIIGLALSIVSVGPIVAIQILRLL
jgi:hypothetical protein